MMVAVMVMVKEQDLVVDSVMEGRGRDGDVEGIE